jgi:uncharacterized protein YPO0396
MDSLFATGGAVASGFRLHKLELYNWGTFDSRQGHVHAVRPEGATTLLIGQNGSGKSTVVDAILTLLVRPVVRNYNVAAGAHKQERDERTYIKGAFGRFSRDDDNRAEVQFLRADGKQYSAILACFRNDHGDVFTAAQVLYLSSDGTPEKVYCLASKEMSISEHCARLAGTDRVRQQLEKRGFRATTSYTEYHSWFQRLTGVRPKAMDMFNQTVAVKDIQSLNRFIREHMLEAKPWRDKIESLQTHFAQLSDAHQSLVRVRKQFTLLGPVVEKGREYTEKATALAKAERLQAASDLYFRQATIDLFTPACVAKEEELVRLAQSKQQHTDALRARREDIRHLTNEIEQAGGDRLKQLPLLIEREDQLLRGKKNVWHGFCGDLRCLGLPSDIHDATSYGAAMERLPALEAQISTRIAGLNKGRDENVVARAQLNRQKEDDAEELQSLNQRQGNLPEGLSVIRRRLCDDLRLPEKDLPFAAELVAVKPEQREWQASAEMVLRSFSLSLLVPVRHYAVVSAYIDRTRLTDNRGQGQRLHYVKVGERSAPPRNRPAIHAQSLLRKLDLREGHPLLPWVKAEIEDRFDLRCCDTIEEFQAAADWAMTRQRHLKWRGERHEKDDRERTADPRNFVLGWDNREKRRVLAEGIARVSAEIERLDGQIVGTQQAIGQLRAQQVAAERVRLIADFGAIDFGSHAREKAALEREKKSLEDDNEAIRTLRDRVKEIEAECERLESLRDATITAEERATNDRDTGRRLIVNAKARLAAGRSDGSLARHQEAFEDIRTALGDEDITVDTLLVVEQAFNAARTAEVSRLREELAPLTNALIEAMNVYLRQFPDEQADLAGRVEYLKSFGSLHEQIRQDDLPRHEARFKEHMNEKVIHEIGLLNGAFQSERTELVSKIDLLNLSLRQLEYRPGTFMRLEPREVRDREILEFRDALRQCLAGTFEGTLEADEARYIRIEKFLARLRDETRWCEKVTDVRRWFDFAARELDAQTAKERAYYEDSTGQSGGEKAKLAFTILVAAIAYQYDLDPTRPASDRFRFVVVDEMFSKVDDQYSEYALELFKKFGLQLLIVAPLDSKARVTEPHVGCYLHVVKDAQTNCSEIFSMTAREFDEAVVNAPAPEAISGVPA